MQQNTALNRYGGLTLVPTSGCLPLAEALKQQLEVFDKRTSIVKCPTPTDIAEPVFDFRSNGEPFSQLSSDHICDHDVYILTSGPGTPKMLIELMVTLMYVVGRHASRITVICGYFPLTRSDKDEGELELALMPHVTHLIQSAAYGDLHRIISCDLHAPQCVMASEKPALITEVSMIRHLLDKVIADALEKYAPDKIRINFPDEGAVKRFSWAVRSICEKFQIDFPIIIGQKTRKSSSSATVGSFFGDLDGIAGSLVIGVDDEIATCSTQRQTAWAFKNTYGASECWATAVHGVFCGDVLANLLNDDCPISQIYTTDTIPFEYRRAELAPLFESGRLHIVSWAKELAQIISCHHWGFSIRVFR
jgi:phosphoribosylpyrophosphate synthetase